MACLDDSFKLKYEKGDTDYNDALFRAFKFDRVELVKLLLQAGADVNTVNRQGRTTLVMAVLYRADRCLEALIGAGADVNCLEINRDTPLIKAAACGYDKAIQILIASGADVNRTNKYGLSALMDASETGRDKCVNILINAGAHVNAKCNEGSTALMFASSKGRGQCVNLLIRAGADVNVKGKDDMTALMLGADGGYANCVNALIKAGADMNVTDRHGCTALIKASQNNFYKCVSLLLKAGADTSIQVSQYKLTALLAATRALGHKSIELLIQAITAGNPSVMYNGPLEFGNKPVNYNRAGSCVNKVDSYGYTALHYVAANGDYVYLDLLIKAGADVNILGGSNVSILKRASQVYRYVTCNENHSLRDPVERHLVCIKLLLKAGAHVNILDQIDQNNALTSHIGCNGYCDKDICMLLIAAGERITSKATQRCKNFTDIFPGYLTEKSTLDFNEICRIRIRKHLLHVNAHSNLFIRIPQLGLPSSLQSYLLYHMSLNY